MQLTPIASSSSGNFYILESDGHRLILEAGIPIKQIMKALRYNLSNVSGCLCSHFHLDHAKSIAKVMGKAIDCYMTRGTAEMIKAEGHRLHIIEPTGDEAPNPPYRPFKIADFWTVWTFPTEHCAGSVAFMVSDGKERMLFLTDSFYFRYKLPGLNIIAIEVNWSPESLAPDIEPTVKKRLLTSHFSLGNVIKFLEANDLSRVREIHLIHISSTNGDEKMFVDKVKAATGIPTYAAQVRPR